MTTPTPPQPIPYQGSKRKLAPLILPYIPPGVSTLYEPFAGSAAVTIAAASVRRAENFVISDSLAPLVGIWDMIINRPAALADAYEGLWVAQAGIEREFYDQVRSAYNESPDPPKLLYLLARCVKNAVRFNGKGEFNQSPDNRRRGVKPATLRQRINAVHQLLHGKADTAKGDYTNALIAASPGDLVYMDPPYMGVSGGRDSRYHQGLDLDRFIGNLDDANGRGLRYLISFDGRKGTKTYGPGLPASLRLRKIELHAGRSSQSTLNGKSEETYESLYISPALAVEIEAVQGSLPKVISLANESPLSAQIPLSLS